MTWKSLIKIGPDLYGEEGYEEWLEKVMQEPWVLALEDLVKWEGVWAGTEEQLIQELKRRVGKEVRESEDFPSTFERVLEYQAYAIHGFLYSGLGVYNYHQELADGDLDDFDVPGWGPEAPVLVEAGDAAHRLYFTDTQFELLKYWHPFPVGIFHLTAGREFKESRTRTFATKELAKALVKYYPTYRNVRHLALKYACPEGVGNFHLGPDFGSDEEFDALINFYGPEAHFIFYKLMRKWAPILKEKARIKISWVKSTTFPGLPESKDPEEPLKIWWTIEAPRWKNPDRFRRTWAIFHDDD